MHTHAAVAEGCNKIILLYYNYSTERGPSKTSTVARLVKAFSIRTGPFMFSDSPSYLYWLGHCQAYARNHIDKYIRHVSLFTSKLDSKFVHSEQLDVTTYFPRRI